MNSIKLAGALLLLASAAPAAESPADGKAAVTALIERYHAAMTARSVPR